MTEVKKESNDNLAKIKSAAEQRFDAVKKAALDIKVRCSKIEIRDDVTLSMANQVLSEANSQLKLVEEKRVQLKKPYFDAGKIIDETANQIKKPLEESLDIGKKKLKEWNDAQEAKRKAEESKLNDSKAKLAAIEIQLTSKADACATPMACEQLIDSINQKFPPFESFGQFKEEAAEAKEKYIKMLSLKKDALVKVIAGGAGSSAAAVAMVEVEAKMKEQTEESIQKAEDKKDAISNTIAASTPKSSVRKTWKWEVYSENDIPREWMSPDPDKIKAYMSANKDKIVPPRVIGGIRFFIEETPIIK